MELFYVITWVQLNKNGREVTRSSDGLFTARPGATRLTVLHQIKQDLKIDGALLFFSLIRNEL